jgi:TRAP-type C4-dicarboxylate transport system permease small subunit
MIIASGWGMLGVALMVTVDVLMRRLLGSNLGGTEELAGYVFAISISWSLAAAFYARSHIRIDVFYQYFPTPLRTTLDILSIVSLLAVAGFLIFSSWLVLSSSYARGSLSASALQVPLAIPQAVWLFGAVWFALSLVVSLAWSLLRALQGQGLLVRRTFGVVTPKEEAQEAIRQSSVGD